MNEWDQFPVAEDWSSFPLANKATQMPSQAPEDVGMLRQFLGGASGAGKQIYRGVKKNIFGLTPEEEQAQAAEAEWMRRAGPAATVGKELTNVASYLPAAMYAPESAAMQTLATVPKIAELTREGLMGRGILSSGLSALYAPKDQGMAALTGGVGSIAGESIGANVASGLGKLLSRNVPAATAGVEEFVREGGKPTIGQATGGGYKMQEEKLRSSPILGPEITHMQQLGKEEFDVATMRKVLDDVESGLSTHPDLAQEIDKDLPVGREGILKLQNTVNKAYDTVLDKLNGSMTPSLREAIYSISSDVKGFGDKQKKVLDDTITDIQDKLGLRKTMGGEVANIVDGQTLKNLQSSLYKDALAYKVSLDPQDRKLGERLFEIKDSIDDMMKQENPQYADALSGIDSAYHKLAIIESAQNKSKISEGQFTPGQLLAAIAETDKTKRHRKFARGEATMQDWAQNAQNIIGQSYKDSGTPGRQGAIDLLMSGGLAAGSGLAQMLASGGAPGIGTLAASAVPVLAKYGPLYMKSRAYTPEKQAELVAQAIRNQYPSLYSGQSGLQKLLGPFAASRNR